MQHGQINQHIGRHNNGQPAYDGDGQMFARIFHFAGHIAYQHPAVISPQGGQNSRSHSHLLGNAAFRSPDGSISLDQSEHGNQHNRHKFGYG
ncbi:hypothetical protein D3C75_1007360 [compost metagenome]